MEIRRWSYVLPVAFTYIGTVVGAGFASGQEILHFFTRYGLAGKVGILIASCLFAIFGSRMMILGARLNATSFKEVNHFLFGERIAPYMNLFVGIMLFGVTSAMIAGIGAIFSEQLHLPSVLGMVLAIVLGIWILRQGLEAILSLNTLVVPLMILFTVLLVVYSLKSGSMYITYEPSSTPWGYGFFSAFTYVSYNLAMAQAILVPMGREIEDERVLRWGAWIGAIFLGLLLLGADYSLALRGERVFQFEIPMAMLIAEMGKWVSLLFLLVVLSEIFTTYIANVYGLGKRLAGWLGMAEITWIVVIVFSALVFAQIGFQNFITRVYPFFGYCGFLYMVMLFVRNIEK